MQSPWKTGAAAMPMLLEEKAELARYGRQSRFVVVTCKDLPVWIDGEIVDHFNGDVLALVCTTRLGEDIATVVSAKTHRRYMLSLGCWQHRRIATQADMEAVS